MILSSLSGSIQPIIDIGVHFMLNSTPRLCISGSMLRAVRRMYSITSPFDTSSRSSPDCDLLVSRICCSRRVMRSTFSSISV